MRKRPGITNDQLKERLAAVLRDHMVEIDGKLERAIPYEHARQMTADQIIGLFHFDHGIQHAIGGPHVHWNLTPRLIAEHRRKTATADRPQIAKTQRIAAAHEVFQRRILAKREEDTDADRACAAARSALDALKALERTRKATRKWPKRQLRSANRLRTNRS